MKQITVKQDRVNTTFSGIDAMNVQVETSIDKEAKVTLEFYCQLTSENIEGIREMMSNNYTSVRSSDSKYYDDIYAESNTYNSDAYWNSDNPNYEEDECDYCTGREIAW